MISDPFYSLSLREGLYASGLLSASALPQVSFATGNMGQRDTSCGDDTEPVSWTASPGEGTHMLVVWAFVLGEMLRVINRCSLGLKNVVWESSIDALWGLFQLEESAIACSVSVVTWQFCFKCFPMQCVSFLRFNFSGCMWPSGNFPGVTSAANKDLPFQKTYGHLGCVQETCLI